MTSPSQQEGDHMNEEGHVLKIFILLFFAESQTINIQPKKSRQNGKKKLMKNLTTFLQKSNYNVFRKFTDLVPLYKF